jgi:RHS repeat-associated protein
VTSANGAVVARSDYDSYGNPTTTATPSNPFGYAGQYTDHATGLIYMRARWYDPATGQFITSDPIGHASGETNLYRYAGGDPANIVDPSGLFGLSDIADAAAGFGDRVTGLVSTATYSLTGGQLDLPTTSDIRRALGVDYVDYCSGWYDAGGRTGEAVAAGAAMGGLLKIAGTLAPRLVGEADATLPIDAASRRLATVAATQAIKASSRSVLARNGSLKDLPRRVAEGVARAIDHGVTRLLGH